MLQLAHRSPHTIIPAVLVLVGGFSLRWVLVQAGQVSHMISVAGP